MSEEETVSVTWLNNLLERKEFWTECELPHSFLNKIRNLGCLIIKFNQEALSLYI